MNRQFIYRVWSIEENKYVMTGALYGCEGTAGLSQYFNRNHHIIEEYTGINDSKGNKIFEGDIIDFTARYKQHGPSKVIFYGASFGCIINDESNLKEYWHLNSIIQYHPTIIGSYLQNPCKHKNNHKCTICIS